MPRTTTPPATVLVAQYLTPHEAAHRLACSPKLLATMRRSGTGPRFAYVGGLVRYSVRELEAWMTNQQCAQTTPRPIR